MAVKWCLKVDYVSSCSAGMLTISRCESQGWASQTPSRHASLPVKSTNLSPRGLHRFPVLHDTAIVGDSMIQQLNIMYNTLAALAKETKTYLIVGE